MRNEHHPVLLQEVIENLAIKPNGIYIDATFGRGGHSKEILKKLGEHGRLLVLDRDLEAIAYAKQELKDPRVFIKQASFSMMKMIAEEQHVLGRVQGILLDLGVSSPQLETPERGFSFLKTGNLDMRMDTSQSLTAAEWISQTKEEEMSNIFRNYGEERYAKRIAAAIIKARAEKPIVTTTELAEIVAKAHPHWDHRKHPATRVFQAIRIYINQELQQLENALNQSLEILAVGGRLLVISFHSLEDRIVKNFIRQHNHKSLKKLAKIKSTRAEILRNPRSRSALLRVAEKMYLY